MSTRPQERAAYQAPTLVHYGSLYDLTSSGTGSKPENTGNDQSNPNHIRT